MAVSPSSYAVGNRVYNGGSSMPTAGTVDPTGYINRELNNQASQSRSGLAAAALRRVQGGQAATQPSTTATLGGGTVAQPVRSTFAQPAFNNQREGSDPLTGITPGLPRSGPLPPTAPISSATGTLSPGIPWDQEAADSQIQAYSELSKQLNDLTASEQSLNRNYTTSTRAAEQAHPGDLRNDLNNAAGRGMAFSSGYGLQVGQTNQNYAQTLNDLLSTRTEGVNAISGARTQAQQDYQQQLSLIANAAVRRLAETRAGKLGLK